jgi:hypothetical protein
MRLSTPLIVGLSFALSTAIIGAALWSVPSVRIEFSDAAYLSPVQWLRVAEVLLPLLALCSWPWVAALARAFRVPGDPAPLVFAVVGILLAAVFYVPISGAPAEGIGYNVIFFVLLAWIAYPLSLLARTN